MYHEQCRIVVLNGTQHRRGIAVQNNPTIAATDPALIIYGQSRNNKVETEERDVFLVVFCRRKTSAEIERRNGTPGGFFRMLIKRLCNETVS